MVLARQSWLHNWNIDTPRGRLDYDCDEHTFDEMQDASYFGAIFSALKQGDLLFVTDGKQDRYTIEIGLVDATNRKVWFSIVEKFATKPVTASSPEEDPGVVIKWRGPRGGMFCLVDKDGNILKSDLRNKPEAEKALSELIGKREAA